MVIIFLTTVNLFAQKGKEKDNTMQFGKLSDAETQMTFYDKDPSAAAVVLFDRGFLDLDMKEQSSFDGTFRQHTRIKIFTKELIQEKKEE